MSKCSGPGRAGTPACKKRFEFFDHTGYSETQMMVGDHPEQPHAFLHKLYEAKVLIDAINQILTLSNA